VDVVGLELTHHVRLGDGAIDVADHHLLVFTPEEDLELHLLGLSVQQLQDYAGFVLACPQMHLLQHLRVGRLPPLHHLDLLDFGEWSEGGRLFLLDVQLGDIAAAEDGVPTLLVFGLDQLISKVLAWLHPEREFARQHRGPQLPGVETVVDSDYQVGVADDAKGILDKLLVFNFVGVEHLLSLLPRRLLLHLGERLAAERELEQGLL